MNAKVLIYFIVMPFSMWTVLSLNIEKIFKKGHINQIRIFYLFLAIIMTYLLTNFIWDFIELTR